jgi:saccharopine dehydrogenase-like NADP-dependent oxidoreductase
MSRVLTLGAGLVAKPLVDELLQRRDLELTVAALNVERARKLTAGGAKEGRARAVRLDVDDHEALAGLVETADLVVSLLPAFLHVAVAEQCLEHGVPLVTTSYATEEMQALDTEARDRGVLLLTECGLDPGIDHMMVVETIRHIGRGGGRVRSFVSYCGGLPAPDSADNPFRYKLSWNPRGVLVAARTRVRFLRDGRVVEYPNPYLPEGPRTVSIPGIGDLEGYPNRDSIPYGPLYGIENPVDLFRGTLRYPGWCETMQAFHKLGLLDPQTEAGMGPSYCDLLDQRLPPGSGPMPARIARFLELPEDHPVLDRLAWLGLLSQQPVPEEAASPLDALAHLVGEKLQYEEGQRDMVVQEHRFGVEDADGKHRWVVERMVAYGDAGDDSAMARTVGLPAALAAELVLDGKVGLTGVQIPVAEEVATPVLRGLRERGIEIGEPVEEAGNGDGDAG